MTYLESHGASSSRNFSFLRWNTLLTAKHMNRVIRVTLSRSNGREAYMLEAKVQDKQVSLKARMFNYCFCQEDVKFSKCLFWKH